MIRLSFAVTDIQALETERDTHPHPKVQRRREALYLKSLDLPHQLICRICRISEPALVRYLRSDEQQGLVGLQHLGYRGQPSDLKAHAQSLEAYFREHLPHTCTEAQAVIKQKTGVQRGLTQVRGFLHRLGMKCRKTGFVPGKADTTAKQAEQAEYLKKTQTGARRSPSRSAGGSFPSHTEMQKIVNTSASKSFGYKVANSFRIVHRIERNK
jgi:transposase